MLNNRYGLLRGAVHWPALHAVLRVRDGLLVRTIRYGHALHADRKTRRVHHDEHVFEAAILFADQVADCATVIAELKNGCRARLDPEFVFDRHAMHVVALTQRAVLIDEELRHDDKRNALHAFWRIRRAREHEVDDVVLHVVLAPRDENLRAEQLERTIALRLCT